MFTPAASAAGSLCRIAAQARPGRDRTCQNTSANIKAATITVYRKYAASVVAISGRRTAGLPNDDSVWPRNPGPPFGKFVVVRTTVIAPASINVISARYSPLRRSAGRPTSVPSTIVIMPAMSRTSGNGIDVAYASLAATHAPSASTAICPSETSPTRPMSSPSPSATTE